MSVESVFMADSVCDPLKMSRRKEPEKVARVPGGPVEPSGAVLFGSDSRHRLRFQSSQANQVVGRADQGEPPTHFSEASQLHLLQQPDHLHPAEGLLDPFAFLLADLVAGVPRGASVHRTPTPSFVDRKS